MQVQISHFLRIILSIALCTHTYTDETATTNHIDKVENLAHGVAHCVDIVRVDVGVAQVWHKLAAPVLWPVFCYKRTGCKMQKK